MRAKFIAVAGLGAAALVLSTVPSGAASATGSAGAGVALRASSVSASHSASATTTAVPMKGAKCGTGFGPELPTPDGLIAWNDGGSFNTAGGADVVCNGKKKKRSIKKVSAYGYFGATTETFNVTFWGDSADPSEPADDPSEGDTPICSYTGLVGSAGGQYPTHALTVLTLPSKCVLPKGVSWVEIQNANASGPWYWEMQDAQGGNTIADWVDRNDAFGSGCTLFDNNKYLVDCLGYPYPDFMLKLN